jgi:hypothetical protein
VSRLRPAFGADRVANAIRFFEGERYELDAWVVMPNHVHAVLWPFPNFTLYYRQVALGMGFENSAAVGYPSAVQNKILQGCDLK